MLMAVLIVFNQTSPVRDKTEFRKINEKRWECIITHHYLLLSNNSYRKVSYDFNPHKIHLRNILSATGDTITLRNSGPVLLFFISCSI